MEKITFVGGYDKTDLVLSIARILTLMNNRVLVLDTTVQQKTRYIVPVMKPAAQYVATYFDVDVACGFRTMEELAAYYTQNGLNLQYDYLLLDIDSLYYYVSFGVSPNDKQFFVTSFDTYSLRRGLSCFARVMQPVHVRKVYFTKKMEQVEDDYLNFLSKEMRIEWDQEIIFFPFETADLDAIFDNQRKQRIRLNGLSTPYCDSVQYICELITNKSQRDVAKAMKQMN